MLFWMAIFLCVFNSIIIMIGHQKGAKLNKCREKAFKAAMWFSTKICLLTAGQISYTVNKDAKADYTKYLGPDWKADK